MTFVMFKCKDRLRSITVLSPAPDHTVDSRRIRSSKNKTILWEKGQKAKRVLTSLVSNLSSESHVTAAAGTVWAQSHSSGHVVRVSLAGQSTMRTEVIYVSGSSLFIHWYFFSHLKKPTPWILILKEEHQSTLCLVLINKNKEDLWAWDSSWPKALRAVTLLCF